MTKYGFATAALIGLLAACDSRAQIADLQPAEISAEAKLVIAGDTTGTLTPLSSARVGCEHALHFVGPASRDGTLAAMSSCRDALIVDTVSGKILQRIPKVGVRHLAYAEGDDVRFVVLFDQPRDKRRPGFYQASSRHGLAPVDLPLPEAIKTATSFGSPQQAVSADGRIWVLEFRYDDAPESIFAAYDLPARKIIWQAQQQDGGGHRLISHVNRTADGYVLVSEVRAANGTISGATKATEQVALINGAVTFGAPASGAVYASDLDRPTCHLVDKPGSRETADPVEALVFADGRQIVLADPRLSWVAGCAVSADGGVLLVSAPPFIHRYRIKP